jgi:HEAT repeat protein
MCERQLDLFSASGIPPQSHAEPRVRQPELVPADLDDAALIAAIPPAGIADAPDLAAEAGRRQLVAAIAALEQLCLRFAGFGLERAVPEQVAALRALALIGGPESAQAVARLIARSVVQGPTRKVALGIAARLNSALPAATVIALLQDADPDVRADACRCAGAWRAAIPVLLDLTDDADGSVRIAALCALGRLGSREARPGLARLLRDAPSVEIIDAVAGIADEDCVIVLGRIVRTRPALADAGRAALELIDHPRARQVVAALAAERDQPDTGK